MGTLHYVEYFGPKLEYRMVNAIVEILFGQDWVE